MALQKTRKARVSYFFKPGIGNFYYGPGHPMKPHRLRLTHSLLLSYNIYRKMEVLRPHDATAEEMQRFHSADYVDFLRRISPDTETELQKRMGRFNIGPQTDCPIFDGLYEFMSNCAGASIDAGMLINHGRADVCVNWSGGLHHAKKSEASGFCYVNDIVLCILELLKYHARVLYVDIDIHHGDGVEEAFYTTNRVMTASFHKYGDFFPGSGDFRDVGVKEGKHCSVNFPLKEGLTDEAFESIYRPIISKIMEVYKPEAVVMCCGADSIAGDRLGCWNLTLKGHAGAVRYMREFGVPVVVLGGGGYTPRNVARCWAYETAVCLGEEEGLSDSIPDNEFYSYFGPDHQLHVVPDDDLENRNTRAYLEKYTATVLQNLAALGGAPSVAFQDVPPDFYDTDAAAARTDSADPDRREAMPQGRRAHDAEFYDVGRDPSGGASSKRTLWDGKDEDGDVPMAFGSGETKEEAAADAAAAVAVAADDTGS